MRAFLIRLVIGEPLRRLAVCFSFSTIDRQADAFGFFVPVPLPSKLERSSCWPAATTDHLPMNRPNLRSWNKRQSREHLL